MADLVASSPTPTNNIIDFTTEINQTIYFTNTGTSAIVPNIVLGNSLYTVSIDRCSGKSIKAKSNCYMILAAKTKDMVNGENLTSISNSSSPAIGNLTTLKYTKAGPIETSKFSKSSILIDSYSNTYSFSITNNTLSSKSYAPVFSGTNADKFSIILNRCNNISPKSSCTISMKMFQVPAGSFSATITEPSVTGSIAVSAEILWSPIPASNYLVKALSTSPSSLNFGVISKVGVSPSGKKILITNVGTLPFVPVFEFSSPLIKIELNRCQAMLQVNKSCELTVTMSIDGSYQDNSSFSQYVDIYPEVGSSSYDRIYLEASVDFPNPQSCPSGQHINSSSGLCVSDTQACSSLPTGMVNGVEQWNANNQSYGLCEARNQADCDTNYSFNLASKSCDPAQLYPTGWSLVKDVNILDTWTAAPENACVTTSSNPLYGGQVFPLSTNSNSPIGSQISQTDCNNLKSFATSQPQQLLIYADSSATVPYCEIYDSSWTIDYYVQQPNSFDPMFCYSLQISSATYELDHQVKTQLGSTFYLEQPFYSINFLEYDNRLFFLRNTLPMDWGYRKLSSTSGVVGNFVDHLNSNFNVVDMVKVGTKLYIAAEKNNNLDSMLNQYFLFRLDNSSQTLNEASVSYYNGHIQNLIAVDNILVIVGDNYSGWLDSSMSSPIELTPTLGGHLSTKYEDLYGHIMKQGNVLYIDPESYGKVYSYNLSTGLGGEATNVTAHDNPSPVFTHNSSVVFLPIGSHRYIVNNNFKLLEINSDQSVSIVHSFSTSHDNAYMGDHRYLSSNKALINYRSTDGGVTTSYSYILNADNNSLSSFVNPSGVIQTYDSVNSRFIISDNNGTRSMDLSGNITQLSSAYKVSEFGNGGGWYLTRHNNTIGTATYMLAQEVGGGYYDPKYFAKVTATSVEIMDELCVNGNTKFGTDSIVFNGSLFVPSNSCQGEGIQHGGSSNNQEFLELFKFTP